MTLAIVYSRAGAGISAPLVTVEAHVSFGMAGFYIVGLPEAVVKESRDRIRSAFMNTHFEFPNKRVMINLAPADLPKEGARFDLPIALGILAASGQISVEELQHYEFVGELALSGELRPIRGVLPVALQAHRAGRALIVPSQNATEAGLLTEAKVFAASHLLAVCAHLKGEKILAPCEKIRPQYATKSIDFSDVKGQLHAKRALEVAAAGNHSLLMLGPPGSGKTMLACRLPSILPHITEEQALEVATVTSVSSNGFDVNHWGRIPFRSPHHSSSSAALVGGGRPPRPGEISLAHHGILFLDELPEFSRVTLECLREPLESGSVTISRASFQTVFPAKFQFIAAMNPCPCGFSGNAVELCQCSSEQIKKYRNKLSGPLLDRIDMQIEVARLGAEHLMSMTISESSECIRKRVILARERQLARQAKCNAHLSVPELEKVVSLQPEAQSILQKVMSTFNLSARVYHRLLKMALSIADLEKSDVIRVQHVTESLQYRCLDKQRKI